MIRRIYYIDPACRTFEAAVTGTAGHEGRTAVLLDQTAFYPTSGGQPFDTGTLGGCRVIDVVESGDEILHVIDGAAPASGTRVAGEIDWARRFDHMQQHTGQHVLSAAFDRLLDDRTVSFHMGAETASIDLEKEVGAADVERVVEHANQVVWEDRQVSIRFVSAAEVATLPLRKEPVREGQLRLIDVDGFDLSACGGTHVARTGEIGMIAVLGAERFKGGSRITFACGGRALRALRVYRDAVAGSVRALSVLPAELPAAVEKTQAEARELRKTIARQQDALATYEAARLLAAAGDGDPRVIVESLEGWEAGGLKAIAAAMTAQARCAVALFSTSTPMSVVVARSPDSSLDANAVLKELMQRFGGRGGGRKELAQGGGLNGDAAEMLRLARALFGSQGRS